MLSHECSDLRWKVSHTPEPRWADTTGCPASWPSRAPGRTLGAWARGLGSTEEAQAHTYLLQPVLLPPALTRTVDERPRGHFVVIQQADDDHDHHRNHHNDDDDLGELQLRCEGRGNRVNHVSHSAPQTPSPQGSLTMTTTRH